MPCGNFIVDLACLKYISIGNKWKTHWWSLWSHQPFSERDGYNSRVVSIIYSGEGPIIPDKERTLPFPSCYTTSLIWQSRHNLLVFMNERDYEWRDIIVEGIRETFQTRVLIKRDVFSRVYHMCQEEMFLHSLTDRILWEQGNPNHHTSFFLRRHVVWQIPPLLWVMLIKARIGHSAPSKSFCNTDGLFRATTLRTASYGKSMELHLTGKWSGCSGRTVIIAISEGNWCYWCTVSEKYSSCTMSLKGHLMYFTDNIACRCATWYVIMK
jgi:hypothetical protein